MVRPSLASLALVVCLFTAPSAAATTRTWSGVTSANWTEPSNWSPAGAPVSGDALVFPSASSRAVMVNDLPAGSVVGSIALSRAMTLSGNPLTLAGDVTGSSMVWNIDLKIGAPLTLDGRGSVFNGAVDVNGQTLRVTTRFTPFNGPIRGTGNIVFDYAFGPPVIAAAGDFSGQMTGVINLMADMPNASVVMGGAPPMNVEGLLAGRGTVAHLRISGASSVLEPITSWPQSGGRSGHATFRTGTLTIGGTYNASFGGIASDRIEATGPVTLGGTLILTPPFGVQFTVGDAFKIIDNQGTQPIGGIFAGLPEGAVVTAGPYSFRISYTGGDGNDVVLTKLATAKSWTAACASQSSSGLWSDACNWNPQSVPQPGEDLEFGTTSTDGGLVTNNDLPAGFLVGKLTMVGFEIRGNPLTLGGDITVQRSYPSEIVADATLSRAVRVIGNSGFVLRRVFLNGQTLTAEGPTALYGPSGNGHVIGLIGLGLYGGDFSGTASGYIGIQANLPNVVMSGPDLEGSGELKAITIDAGGDLAPGPTNCPSCVYDSNLGTIRTGDLTLRGNYAVEVAKRGVDQIRATGNVVLSGATLSVTALDSGPWSSMTIIDNRGASPVTGTFSGLPEGASVQVGSKSLRITYVGGDGNDVVLLSSATASVALSQSAASTSFGESFVLTAALTTASNVSDATVTFYDASASIGTASLAGGVATLNLSTLEPGAHNLIATVRGSSIGEVSSSALSHAVARGQTSTTVTVDRPASAVGQAVRYTVAVAAQTPASGAVGGSATILADGVAIGNAAVVAGTGTFVTSLPHPGKFSVTARYDGDAHFEGSTSTAIQQTVEKAPTVIDARPRAPIFAGASPTITVFVNATTNPALFPSGSVSVMKGDTILGQQMLANGTVRIVLAPLAAGEHELAVTYGGDADFEPSRVTVMQIVSIPGISVEGTRAAEGHAGITTVSLLVSLSTPVSVPVRVSFSTLGGSATEGVDFEKTSGVIELAPGEQTRSIELHLFGDTLFESDETFSVQLFDPVNVAIDKPSAIVVIANDDQAPARRRPSRH